MKKVSTLLFVSIMLTFAACQSKPANEETTVESAETMGSDTATMVTDSASTMTVDSIR